MGRTIRRLPLLWLAFLPLLQAGERATLNFVPDGRDATVVVREALAGVTARDLTLVFAPGRYVFRGDLASEQYLAITNHDNGMKRIAFPLDRFDSVRIEGNGAEFVFHGQMLPFLFRGCGRVEVASLTIDWDIPFYFQATVTAANRDEGWIEVAPFEEGFSWTVRNGLLLFPNVDGFAYDHLGETLAFDPRTRRVAHGAWDLHLASARVERLRGGRLRLPVPGPHLPEVGTVIVSKGRMGENRYAPAFHGIDSRNIRLEDVTVHHALGMGYLFERCDTITLRRCGAYVRPGSDRVVSLIADATHFCHTKGAVLIEDCRFQHMLDDGVNVHGAYVVVDQVLNPRQVRVKLMHFQQLGFRFADPGDEVWLIHAPDPGRAAVRSVQAFEPLNERYSVVTFTEPVSDRLRPGDLLENKTWIPSFTMRGCTIKDHRARGVVLKTPRPIVIEDNDISSMMSGIFFRGESKFWFESGAVGDVLIRNNRFDYCAYSGLEHAVLTVTPRLGDGFDSGKAFDRDIRFEGNRIRTFGDRIVWADRVDGLTIAGNTIVQTKEHPEVHPGKPMIDLVNCRNVRIEGNTYEGDNPASVAADALSAGTLRIGENTGFTVRRP